MENMQGLEAFYGVRVHLPLYDPPAKTADILDRYDGSIEWPTKGNCSAVTLMKNGKAFHPELCDFSSGPPDDAFDTEALECAFFDAACRALGIRAEGKCSFSDWEECPVRLRIHRDDGLVCGGRWRREPSLNAYVCLSYSLRQIDLQRAGYREVEFTPVAPPSQEDVALAERVIDALSLFRLGEYGFHALAC
jgi:hypothetical protein